MEKSNKIVHGLWIGNELSPLEILTLESFTRNGHDFCLWLYDDVKTEIPQGVTKKNAVEILDRSEIFSYRKRNQFGHGKGSYAGFSDIFRYKLLYEYGGWWADMDVTCLKPLDIPEPYVFRRHHVLNIVGNLMKCPQGSKLMELCYNEAVASVNCNNTDWHKPVGILNNNINKLGLEHFTKELSNPDSWNMIRKMLFKNVEIKDSWFVIHWVNEEWRRNRINKNFALEDSLYNSLLMENDINHFSGRSINNVPYRIKLTWIMSALRQLPYFLLRYL